jgi:uncharacterized repeat protein (TIGR01451 family)
MLRPHASKQRPRSVKLNVERLEERLAPATLAQSPFDTGDDGWRIGEFFSNAGDSAPTFLATEGNPPGAIRTTDTFGVVAFQAPAAFLGDQSAAYGGTLHLEQRLLAANGPHYPMVLLSDGTLFLQFRTPPPGTGWTAYDIPLVASAGWEVSNLSDTAEADPPATEEQLLQVLSNLSLFNLRADWRTGADQVDLDNVRLESAPEVDLEVTIADAPDPALTGETLTYTIAVTNHGPGDAANVTLETAVPAKTTFVSFTPLAGGTSTTPAVGGGGAIASTMAHLAAGASASFLFVVHVDSGEDAAIISASTTVSGAVNDLDLSNNTAAAATALHGTVRWNTDSDGLWTDPANWDAGFVPRPGDNAIIDRPGVEITVTLPQGDFSIAGLNSQEKVIIAGGSLTLTKGSQLSGLDIQVDADLVLDTPDPVNGIAGDWNNAGRIAWIGSGSLHFTEGANLNNLAGGLFEIHTAEPAGAERAGISFQGGGLNNLAGAQMRITSSHHVGIAGGSINNEGTLTWAGTGKLELSDAQLNNLPGGLFEMLPIDIFEDPPIPLAPDEPDDPRYGEMNNLDTIHMRDAWAYGQGTARTTIAVVDTGVDYTHPDLYLNIWINEREIPAHIRQNLTDVDGDGRLTLRDLNHRINQGPGKANDVNGNGYIDGEDLLACEYYYFEPPPDLAHPDDEPVFESHCLKPDYPPGFNPPPPVYIGGMCDGIDSDGNGYIDDFVGWNFETDTNTPLDFKGHGTHVAGTIGAMGNNNLGVTGINWNTQIMVLKIRLGDPGEPPPTFEQVANNPVHYYNLLIDGQSQAIDAMKYAVRNGARVSNHSWGANLSQTIKKLDEVGASAGLFEGFQDLKQTMSNAAQSGHIVVAAAGNDGHNVDTHVNPPGDFNLNNMITVANTTNADVLAADSNFGRNKVDLAAPGTNVLSTVPTRGPAADPAGYGVKSGTSMAAPHVTGVIGLVISQHPDWSYQQVIRQVLETVERIPALETRVSTGGRLNALGAVAHNPWIYSPSSRVHYQIDNPAQSIRVAFNKPIKASTLTIDDVTVVRLVRRPRQPARREPVVVTQVVPVPGSGRREFDLHFAGFVGTYVMTIGPNIESSTGYLVDFDHDGIGGEAVDDTYTIRWTSNLDVPGQEFPTLDVTSALPVNEIILAGLAGLTNFPGGTIAIDTTGPVVIGGGPFNNDGDLHVKTGTLQLGAGASTGSFRVDEEAALNFAGNFAWNPGTTFAAAGSIRVDPSDPCCAVLVSGDVALQDLYVGRFGALQVAGAVTGTINVAGTLSGTGTIHGNVRNAGIVRPGSSPGILTIAGNYTQTAAGSLILEVGGTRPGKSHDQLKITGRARLAGRLKVVFVNGYRPRPGDEFRVLHYRSRTGSLQFNKPGLQLSADGLLIKK